MILNIHCHDAVITITIINIDITTIHLISPLFNIIHSIWHYFLIFTMPSGNPKKVFLEGTCTKTSSHWSRCSQRQPCEKVPPPRRAGVMPDVAWYAHQKPKMSCICQIHIYISYHIYIYMILYIYDNIYIWYDMYIYIYIHISWCVCVYKYMYIFRDLSWYVYIYTL